MLINIAQHRRLLISEFMLQKEQFDTVLETPSTRLREEGQLYFAQYAGFDNTRGNLILKLSTKRPFPRRNEHLTAFIPKVEYLNPATWDGLSYKKLRSEPQRICELVPIWFRMEPDERIIIGFRGADEAFVQDLPGSIPIILGPLEPPTGYFKNLIYMLEKADLYPRFKETISIDRGDELWNPNPLDNVSETSLHLTADLAINRDMIIQGPPGTGKSFLIANLCADFLRQGKTVMVAALTNTALIELADKPGLLDALESGQLFKTSLTIDETRKMPGLKNASDYTHKPGTLLLATFYKASDIAVKATGAQFDLVVVEEASQAFLATIGFIRHLGQHAVIVGDQRQLQPIRILKDHDLEHPDLVNAFNGLNTIANSALTTSKYVLVKTFRLSPQATWLTNAFYDDILVSDQAVLKPLNYSRLQGFLEESDAVKCVWLPMPDGLKSPSKALELFIDAVMTFYESNPRIDIAILSFYVDTVKALQRSIYSRAGYNEHITIDTIDRIQGLTVDVCFFFIPNTGLNFSLNSNRFNVATSRARYHTLLFVPDSLNIENSAQSIQEYFSRLKEISN